MDNTDGDCPLNEDHVFGKELYFSFWGDLEKISLWVDQYWVWMPKNLKEKYENGTLDDAFKIKRLQEYCDKLKLMKSELGIERHLI